LLQAVGEPSYPGEHLQDHFSRPAGPVGANAASGALRLNKRSDNTMGLARFPNRLVPGGVVRGMQCSLQPKLGQDQLVEGAAPQTPPKHMVQVA